MFKQVVINMDSEKKVKVVQTIKGELMSDSQLGSVKIVLFHQNLTPNVVPMACNTPVDLESIRKHWSQPQSLQNTSLTPSILEHELQVLINQSKLQHSEILIMDNSNYQSKVNEIFNKYTVAKGYNYRLEGNNSKDVLLSYDHILKQIEYQFKLGNGKYKPAFIGQILLEDCLRSSAYFNAFKAYLSFSDCNSCPVLINCIQNSQVPFAVFFGKPAQHQLQDKWKQIDEVLSEQKDKKARLVILNLPLIFLEKHNTHTCSQETLCLSHQKVQMLLSNTQVHLGFDLNKYAICPFALNYIAMLCQKYSSRIVLSSGITCKTELTVFGGDGYKFHSSQGSSHIRPHFQNIVEENKLREVTLENGLRLLDWKLKTEKVELIMMWECDKCGKSQSEKIQAFKKFGKNFCSMNCLKSFNF